MPRLAICFFALLMGFSLTAAAEGLEVKEWLGRPGVRAVAVEFYARWCGPCMEAMPRWKDLKDRYGKQGLKVIVVNTRDENGGCATLGWKPDANICDIDGVLADQFGVKNLPAAFLWSWQGSLHVQGGHITEVEREVEAMLKSLPRVAIMPDGGIPPSVTAAVRQRLTDADKLVVVADDKARASLQKILVAQQGASVNPEARCELDKEVPPNTLLRIGRVDGGREKYLQLELFDAETKCQKAATTVPWDAADPAGPVRDAVENLLAKLRTALEMPGAGAAPKAAPSEVTRTGTLVVTSDVDGAQLTVDGVPRPDPIGPKRPIALDLKAGEHRLRISKDGYFDDLRTVAVSANQKATLAAKLVPEKKQAANVVATETTSVLQVDTKPSGAVIIVDDVPMGRAPGMFEMKPGKHIVKARLDWYREATATVQLEAGMPLAKMIELAPDFGKLEVTSATPGVTIALDDRVLGTASPTLSRSPLTPGDFRLRATLPDHHEYATTVRLVAGGTAKVSIPAMRSALGSLRIVTDPPGALIKLDDVDRGVAPVTVERLTAGAHSLEATLADHLPLSQPVEVLDGQMRSITLRMESSLAPVSVSSKPAGARVLIDGRERGRTPLQLTLEEGDHAVRVEADLRAYRPWTGRITAVRGKPAQVSADLVPIHGALMLTTTPFGADASLDGKPAGTTPLKLATILGGPHRLIVKKAGHRIEDREIVIEGEKSNRIDLKLVELLPEELAAQRIAEWETQTEPQRAGARLKTGVSIAAGVAALGLGVAGLLQFSARDQALEAYGAATDTASELHDQYTAAHWRGVGLAAGAGVGLVVTGLMSWLAASAWGEIPERPVFEVVGSGGTAGER